MYTFYKIAGGTVVTHTDGMMYATTDGAEIKFDNSSFKIDMDANTITFTKDEIAAIGEEKEFTDNKHIIDSLINIFG